MKHFLNNDHLMALLRTCGEFFAIWPLDENAGRGKIVIYNIMWSIYLLNGLALLGALILGIHCCTSRLVDLMKSLVEMTYILEAIFNVIYCRRQRHALKSLLIEMELFERTSSQEQKMLKQEYLRRTKNIYTILPTIFVVGALIFVFSPLVMNRTIPLNSVYILIPIDQYWGWSFVYAINVFSIMQASVAIVVDMVVVTIIIHASYKFDFVGMKLQTIVYEELRTYLRLHQKALRYLKRAVLRYHSADDSSTNTACLRLYAKQVDSTVTPIIVKSTAAVCMYMITCSLLLLNNVPFFELAQFFLITFLSCLRLFVCSWSAQSMTEMAKEVGWRVYATPWCRSTLQVRKMVLIIVHQCQQPVVIAANGIIPTLSLNFCGSVLYKTFSFFMTLRVILHV